MAYYFIKMVIISIKFEERSEGADEILIWIPQTSFSNWFFSIFYLCISSFSFFNLRKENKLIMNEIYLTIFFISLLLFLLGSGIWVALSMIAVSAVGMLLFTTRPVGDAMATTIWGTSSSWTLTALPLFVWMGEILFRTKLSENLFKGYHHGCQNFLVD